MSDLKRIAVAVTLLAEDPTARRLVVSWQLVPPKLTGRRMLRAWARLAGVDLAAVDRLAPGLQAHEICRPDRTIDPEAGNVINHVAAAMLRKGRKGG